MMLAVVGGLAAVVIFLRGNRFVALLTLLLALGLAYLTR